MFHNRFILLAVLPAVLAGPALAQAPRQSNPPRPVLIRDTDTAEGKDTTDAEKEKEYSPLLARENLKIGDFYLKRKNYGAAIARYQDAVEYQPNLFEAWESLARAHEKNKEADKAVEAWREYIRKNPDSPKQDEVKERIAKLERKEG